MAATDHSCCSGSTGPRVTQTDSYVVGEESYRTDIAVTNSAAAGTTATLYRAGDCYLQGSDFGYGTIDPATGAVSCTASADPGARIEQMLPLTAGSRYYESFYSSVWAAIGTQAPFPSTCDCGLLQDNGLGLSWDLTLAAGQTKTYSSLVTFSPLGRNPLTVTKTADAGSVPAGGSDGYTITVTNNNISGVPLTALTDALPAHGTLSGSAPALTYTPAAGYSGPDSFTFKANDGHADSNVATVSITVTPVVTPPATTPRLDVQVSADQPTANSRISAPAISTHAGQELILAFVTADGPRTEAQRITGVTGGGLTWTLAKRANATGGTTEVWQAYAAAPLTAAVVRATFAIPGYDGSITVAAFTGAASHLGASAATTGITGGPAATITPAAANSLIWATGHDWSHEAAPVAGAGQTFVHSFLDTRVHDSFWVQQVTAPTAGTAPVTVSDTGLTRDRWQLVAAEIPAAS